MDRHVEDLRALYEQTVSDATGERCVLIGHSAVRRQCPFNNMYARVFAEADYPLLLYSGHNVSPAPCCRGRATRCDELERRCTARGS